MSTPTPSEASPTVTSEADSLSVALKTATAEAHERAENSGFMSRLLDGAAGRAELVALLAQSLPVYEALEAAVSRNATDPRLAPLVDSRLDRASALRADLAEHRAAGFSVPVPTPATRAYVTELHDCADDSAALVGHHYVRYLGDLSGGQIISRLVRRHYGFDDGLSFYDFDIDKPKTYKDDYRRALDALPLDGRDRAAALDAANRAFELNSAIFAELGGAGHGGAGHGGAGHGGAGRGGAGRGGARLDGVGAAPRLVQA